MPEQKKQESEQKKPLLPELFNHSLVTEDGTIVDAVMPKKEQSPPQAQESPQRNP